MNKYYFQRLSVILFTIYHTSFVNPSVSNDEGSSGSSHWRICDDSQVRPADALASDEDADDVMHILRAPRYNKFNNNGEILQLSWTVLCKDCSSNLVYNQKSSNSIGSDLVQNSEDNIWSNPNLSRNSVKNKGVKSEVAASQTNSDTSNDTILSCRPFVNISQYDYLPGVAARNQLSTYPEPEVAAIFRRNGHPVHLESVSRRLATNLVSKPRSVQVFNQIGNLLRVRGDSTGAVECFRRALSIQPNNPDVLLNLARILFNHKYLNDAITLTRRSLETQSPDRNAWLQHFTLGEILRAYGHISEAAHHFKHAVALNPGFAPAQAHLRELDPVPQPPLTAYTFAIILFLVLGVLAGLLTTAEANLDAYGEVMKTQRHFNRAMAMKTLKLSINPKVVRSRRQN